MRLWETQHRRTPSANGEPKVLHTIFGTVKCGEKHLSKVLNRGNPIEPALVETKDSPGLFLTPLELPKHYSNLFYQRALRARRLVSYIVLFYLITAGTLAVFFHDLREPMSIMTMISVAFLVYFYVDYRSGFLRIDSLKERSQYFNWLFLNSRPYLLCTGALFVVMGSTQFLFSGNEFINRFGMYFGKDDFRLYQLITGPLVHSSLSHWMTNFAIALGIAIATGPTLRIYYILVFITGCLFAFGATFLWMQYFPSNTYNGLVGSSGGLAALLGCHLSQNLRHPSSYPKGYLLNLGFFSFVSLALGTFIIARYSLACHVFGAIGGALLSVFVPDYLDMRDEGTGNSG